MSIDYGIEPGIKATELAEVFIQSGIRRPSDDLPRLSQMIANADLIVAARDNGRLVGIARSLTDFCYACYLSDLAVDKAYQHWGIGKELVRLTRDAIGESTMLLLIAASEAAGYYGKIGFEKMDRAWWINRTR